MYYAILLCTLQVIKSQLSTAVCLKPCLARVLSFNVSFEIILLLFLLIVMLMVLQQEENDVQGNSSFTIKEEAHFSESDSEIGMFQNNDSSLDSLGRYIK